MTAESLRFERVPNPKVEFTGRPRRDTVWEAERENLPQQVRPGVTYRNIGITLRITSVFADIDRIVSEALGEIPAGDDAQPQSPPPEQPATPPRSQENSAGNDGTRADDASAPSASATSALRQGARQVSTPTSSIQVSTPTPSPANARATRRSHTRRGRTK